MTNFEEEVRKNGGMCFAVLKNEKISYEIQGLTSSALKIFGNWRSDEDFQTKENELKRLRKLNHLYKKAQDEIAALKSQLQQQALPVVPECVGEWIEHCKGMGYGLIAALTFKLSSTMHEELSAKILKWLGNEGNDETFALAFITGKYEVEKPQLFYLKHIDMSKSDAHLNWYLAKGTDNVLIHQGIKKGKSPKLKCILKLSQQEIDSMQTGSYEQIEVAE